MVKAKSLQSKQMKSRRTQQVSNEGEGWKRIEEKCVPRKNSPISFEGVTNGSAANPITNATDLVGMVKKNKKGRSVLLKRTHNSRLLKKGKKSLKRLEVQVAEERGYTKCLKQLVMEESAVMESAIQEKEAKLPLIKMKNEMAFAENECMEQFIASMLSFF
ncbi:hypothetical protein DITRI_Ditri06bG0132900 [Diplodiscus trichospermus]